MPFSLAPFLPFFFPLAERGLPVTANSENTQTISALFWLSLNTKNVSGVKYVSTGPVNEYLDFSERFN